MSKKPQHAKHVAEKTSSVKIPWPKKKISQSSDTDTDIEAGEKDSLNEAAAETTEKNNNLFNKYGGSSDNIFDNMLLIRLVIASVIFAVSLIIKMPPYARVILLVLVSGSAGYDIFLNALNSIQKGRYFATPVVVSFVTAASFFIGFGAEGAALILLYQIGILLIKFTIEKTRKSAQELLRYQDEETVRKYSDLIKQDEVGHMEIEDTMRYSSGSILKMAMVFAVLYAIALPLFTSYGFIVSIHRALMIILIATPVSVVAAMPITGIVGLCYSAQQGILFKDAAALEKTGRTNVAVIDKTGVLTEEIPHVLSVNPDVIDKDTFMNFASHALYYSEQPVAKAVSAINTQDYRLELISDFKDIHGYGVDLKIGGARVTLATKEYFASKGMQVPESEEIDNSQKFYMTVSDKFVGDLAISDDINCDAIELCSELEALNLNRCILVTEDGEEESQHFAYELSINEVVSGCGTDNKLKLINELKQDRSNHVLYVYSNGFQAHSEADIDMRVGKKAKFADAQVKPEYLTNIPFAIQVSRRTKEVAISNALFAFIVKSILIFLSIIGYCNIWFAIFIDMVAALATVLNAIRVTNESILKSFKQ